MRAISVNLPEQLLESSRRLAAALKISRAAYIRRAVERMNRETEARLKSERMARASARVRKESMKVNAEFASIERDPDA